MKPHSPNRPEVFAFIAHNNLTLTEVPSYILPLKVTLKCYIATYTASPQTLLLHSLTLML